MLKGGKHGPAIVPGKADESLLFRMAAHRVEPVMPPKDKKDARAAHARGTGPAQALDRRRGEGRLGRAPRARRRSTLGELPAGRPADRRGRPDGRRQAGRGGPGEPGLRLRSRPRAGSSPRSAGTRTSSSRSGSAPTARSWRRGATNSPPSGTSPPTRRPRSASPRRFGPHAFRVLAIDFSPDGKLMATGGGEPSRSGEVKLWDVASGQPRSGRSTRSTPTPSSASGSAPTGRSWPRPRPTSSSR